MADIPRIKEKLEDARRRMEQGETLHATMVGLTRATSGCDLASGKVESIDVEDSIRVSFKSSSGNTYSWGSSWQNVLDDGSWGRQGKGGFALENDEIRLRLSFR